MKPFISKLVEFNTETDMFKAGGLEFYIYPDKMAWNRIIEAQVILRKISTGKQYIDNVAMVQKIYALCRKSSDFGATIMDIGEVCLNFLKPLNATPQEPTLEEKNQYARKLISDYQEHWLDLACLYIFIEGEDETIVDPALNKRKKDIWKKHVSSECFFLLGKNFLPQLVSRLKGASISPDLIQELNQKNQANTATKSPKSKEK